MRGCYIWANAGPPGITSTTSDISKKAAARAPELITDHGSASMTSRPAGCPHGCPEERPAASTISFQGTRNIGVCETPEAAKLRHSFSCKIKQLLTGSW